MMGLGFSEILIIAIIILLFFGGKKIPELMRGLGKGVRSFKDGMNDITDVESSDPKEQQKEKEQNSTEK